MIAKLPSSSMWHLNENTRIGTTASTNRCTTLITAVVSRSLLCLATSLVSKNLTQTNRSRPGCKKTTKLSSQLLRRRQLSVTIPTLSTKISKSSSLIVKSSGTSQSISSTPRVQLSSSTSQELTLRKSSQTSSPCLMLSD